ncbi:anterior gradient protein 3-like [Sphaeramia orbicularis]|uniref:Anterior gradient protein 3-like n=1 Tax=Sphaeramia orbicularis TaxID=375764 RepID=A0A673AB04_9TELE|nr:anterior gradient protein 3-like [Sphaeramia orbicularis]XP_029980289.1 anterior gradient protein 3-like [Sphaeramia orbicularis]
MMLRWLLFAVFFVFCAGAGEQKAKQTKNMSRGWGNSISWVKSYEEALSKMVKSNKPLMVIHHREECPYCQDLKKVFVAEKSIQTMAKEDFIMLNLVEETSDPNMAPDGYYVPRIIFVDPSKTVRADISGIHPENLYTYSPADIQSLVNNMKKAKSLIHTEL